MYKKVYLLIFKNFKKVFGHILVHLSVTVFLSEYVHGYFVVLTA